MSFKTTIFALLFIISVPLYSQIAITEVYYDTPYTEFYDRGYPYSAHHLGEYIELYNYTTEDIPLKGWSITDKASKYTFPDDAVIHSESYIIVAYRDLYYGPDTGNYIPHFFPTTQGKETQIYYQGTLMLRNNIEMVNLNMGPLRGVDFNEYPIFTMSWIDDFEESNYDNSPTVNYYTSSLHLQSDNSFTYSTATPLTSDFVPATQNIEDIPSFQDALIANTGNYTWDFYVERLLNVSCPVVINQIEQAPAGTYLPLVRCFNYDVSGNNIASADCSDEEDELMESASSTYNQDELDDIASKIYLYPNPTSSIANISWDDTVIGKINSIQVTNASGIHIGAISVSNSDSTASFNITNQPSTIYIVTFTLDSGQMISKNLIKI